MTNIVNLDRDSHPDRNRVVEEAYAWVIRLDGGDRNERDIARLHDWLAKSSLHQSEFRRIAELWDGLDDIVPKLVFSDTPLHGAESVDAGAHPVYSFFNRFKTGIATAGLAATVLLVLALGGLGYIQEGSDYNANYVSALGELKEIALPDGSEIGLNTSSRADVTYKENARFVHLLEGEAHFDVSHDPDKPFVVYAGDVAVRAVGTAFAVYLKPDQSVEVTVTEGKVQLSSLSEDMDYEELDIAQLQQADVLGTFVKGQHTVTRETVEHIEMFEVPQLEKKLSWRDRMLVFDQDRLEDVVNEVSRYTAVEIVMTDPAIRDMKVGGYFPAGETEVLLNTLGGAFDIRVNKVSEDLILLSQK